MKKVATDVEKRVEAVVQHVVDIFKKPNPTQKEVDDVGREIEDLQKDVQADSWNATIDEIRERLVKDFRSLGMSAEDADKMVEQKWKDVKDLADKLRDTAPKSWKWLTVKVGALAMAAIGMLYMVISQGTSGGNAVYNRTQQVENQSELSDLEFQVETSQEEFKRLSDAIQNIPSVEVPREPEVVRLPVIVAAVEATPVVAVISSPAGTSQTVQTNIGTIYRAIPEARHRLESYASRHHSIHGHADVSAPFGARISLRY
jgi:hypothetical protein